MWIFLGLIALAFGAVGGTITIDARRARRGTHRAGTSAAELAAARARLLAAGEDVDAIGSLGGGVYVSSAATRVDVVDIEPPADARMVKLIIDPTLTEADVVTAVAHVAPGVGSLASFAATVDDTRMRTPSQLRELEAAEVEAYAVAAEEEERILFATFNRRMNAALAQFDDATRRADQWEAYQHRGNEDVCEHCHRAVRETSDEFQQIVARVETESTREISRADLRRMFATR